LIPNLPAAGGVPLLRTKTALKSRIIKQVTQNNFYKFRFQIKITSAASMGNSNSFDMRGSQFDDDGFMSAEGPIQQQFDEPEVAEVKHSNPQFFYKMKVQLIQLFL